MGDGWMGDGGDGRWMDGDGGMEGWEHGSIERVGIGRMEGWWKDWLKGWVKGWRMVDGRMVAG